MRNSTWLWAIIVLILIGLGVWWYAAHQPASPAPDTNGALGADAGAGIDTGTGAESAPMSAAVTYDGTSFSPATVTIAEGGTVTFTNSSTGRMWVASNAHPTHTEYDGTTREEHCATGGSFDQCGTGDSYSFTFTKTGTFNYHNHTNASVTGVVVVQ